MKNQLGPRHSETTLGMKLHSRQQHLKHLHQVYNPQRFRPCVFSRLMRLKSELKVCTCSPRALFGTCVCVCVLMLKEAGIGSQGCRICVKDLLSGEQGLAGELGVFFFFFCSAARVAVRVDQLSAFEAELKPERPLPGLAAERRDCAALETLPRKEFLCVGPGGRLRWGAKRWSPRDR